MAKTSSQCRRRMQSSAGFLGKESRCGSVSMRASPDHYSNHFDLSIKQAIQRRGGKQVQAYVVMALHDDGDISTHTTDQVSCCTNDIFTSDAEERLRIAHKESMLHARTGEGCLDRDLIYHHNFADVASQDNVLDGEDNRMIESPPAESHYDLSRPNSALSYGVSNEWQSDLDDMEPAHSSTFARSRSGGTGTDHFKSLLISESDKVERFLIDRFQTMQQLAVKRIAKAWIKGICPKKQAFFPYHKKKREREGLDHLTGRIPGWWPDTKVCRFVEPDHIKRDERISLCLHLLRLRPTPAQLKDWNKGCVEPHQTHVMKGWTEFLKELAPPSIFDDMREPEGREQQERQKLLAQIYDLAKKEEQFKNEEIDGDDVYYWPIDDSNDKKASRKKNRRSWDLLVDDSGTDSYADSAPPSKRSKKNSSSTTTPAGSPAAPLRRRSNLDESMQDCKPHLNAGFVSDVQFIRSAASPQGPWDHCPSVGDSKKSSLIHTQSMHDLSCMPQAYTPGWINAQSPAPFSDLERQAISQSFAMDMPTPVLPGRTFQWPFQNLETQPQVCPTYATSQLPQPQFEDVSLPGLYPPPLLSHTPPANQRVQQNPFLNGVHYCQPSGAQPFVSSISSPQLNIPPASRHPGSRPCTAGLEQCYTIDPSIYRHHPETNHSSDQFPRSRHGGLDFHAPARVERGFTGHGSGVGGGAHT